MSKVEDLPFQGLQYGRESKAPNHPIKGQIRFEGGQPGWVCLMQQVKVSVGGRVGRQI